jgi:Flp pilus assembly protein TadG
MIGHRLRLKTRIAAFKDDRGTSAVEFAVILPFLMVLYFGTYQASEVLSAYRKMTLTMHTVVDLASQYQTMGTSDMATVLGASAQTMAPFPTANLTIVLTEYATDSTGKTTVTWSKALNGTALVAGKTAMLPTNICQNGASVLQGVVSYSYTPPVGYKITGPIVMSGQLFMNPRQVQSVAYTGT